jgi:hypothetical protein
MPRPFSDLFDDPANRTDLRRLPRNRKLKPGEGSQSLTVPAAKIKKLMPEVGRLVADLPRGASGDVVWTRGTSELLVHTDKVQLTCTVGLIRVSFPVACDQLEGGPDKPVNVTVPFAVGTKERTAGLVMTTYDIVSGPAEVTEIWSDAITAFAWECVLELSRRLSAEVGVDARGRSLIPGSLTATAGKLLIQPVARHDLLSGARSNHGS